MHLVNISTVTLLYYKSILVPVCRLCHVNIIKNKESSISNVDISIPSSLIATAVSRYHIRPLGVTYE